MKNLKKAKGFFLVKKLQKTKQKKKTNLNVKQWNDHLGGVEWKDTTNQLLGLEKCHCV